MSVHSDLQIKKQLSFMNDQKLNFMLSYLIALFCCRCNLNSFADWQKIRLNECWTEKLMIFSNHSEERTIITFFEKTGEHIQEP